MSMRETLLKAQRMHAQGEIEMHRANIEVYLKNPVGIGEHPGITEAISEELDKMARYHDQLEILNKYFKLYKTDNDSNNLTDILGEK